MRLIATADLHYDMADYRSKVRELADAMCREQADVLAIAGDIFAGEIGYLVECLHLFDGFQGTKVLVAGNHDLWTYGGDSFRLYDETIPAAAAACGFHDLDKGPLVVGDVGLVGTVGWYDYSFRDESLGIPLRFYEHKAAPGYAQQAPDLAHLIDPDEALPPRALAARSFWNDGRMIHWDTDDRGFNQLTLERLEAQCVAVEAEVRAIAAITHHIPFVEMLRRRSDPSWGFGNAFMGSAGLGEVLQRHHEVSHVVFGHSHTREHRRVGHVEATNVGCTYKMKRYDIIEV